MLTPEVSRPLNICGKQASRPGGLYAIGYPATAIQPYFSSNIYSDFNDPANGAYWDWSKRNIVQ